MKDIKKHPYQVLLCDLGNVILYFDHNIIYRSIGEYTGFSADQTRAVIDSTTIHLDYEYGAVTDLEFYKTILSLFKLSEKKLPFDKFCRIWCAIFSPNHAFIDTLSVLSQTMDTALISNTNSLHYSYIQTKFPYITQLFGANTILSHKTGLRKPDRRMFEQAVKMMGVTYNQCVYVDDIPEYVNTARELGMCAIVYRNHAEFVDRIKQLRLLNAIP